MTDHDTPNPPASPPRARHQPGAGKPQKPEQPDPLGRNPDWAPWRQRLHEVIFEAETRAGRLFDIVLLVVIALSILVVCLETVDEYGGDEGSIRGLLVTAEWVFTGMFTVEYLLRLICVRKPTRYATSFFGMVDLLAILPSYLALLGVGTHYAVLIRALRLLRIFRVLKMARHLNAGRHLMASLRASAAKVTVFLMFVLMIVLLMGATMYLVEGGQEDTGFTSIPRSMYWAIVTLTTVGYGDIYPQTDLGRTISAIVMIMGYAIIVVPTGLVSAEMVIAAQRDERHSNTQVCPDCSLEGHAPDAVHCRRCGGKL